MRLKALIIRILQQMLRDKRTLALLLVAPLFVLSLMYFIFNGNTVEPKLGTVNVNQQLVQVLDKSDLKITLVSDSNDDTLVDKNLDGILEFNDGKYTLKLQNSDPTKAKALLMKVNQIIAASAYNHGGDSNPNQISVETSYVYGNSQSEFFDVLSPILVGFFVFFFVFLISGIGLLRERTTGTLERLMSTPIKRWEVVLGYLIGYGIFAVIQTIIIVLFAVNVLNMTIAGSIWNVLLINLLLAMVALSLGILLSTFASSEFQMMQFIPIIVIPQVFFSGIFPLSSMAHWLQVISKIMPLYYGADALQSVMYKGLGFSSMAFDLLILFAFAFVFIILNIITLKKYRTL